MSNIITAEIIADTTIESAAKGIATGLSNKTGSADACRWSYLANRAGVSLAELAKAATKIMAADPSSEKSSISKAAIEHRVNAYAFLVENGLPFQSSTVCLSYTLAQKPTARATRTTRPRRPWSRTPSRRSWHTWPLRPAAPGPTRTRRSWSRASRPRSPHCPPSPTRHSTPGTVCLLTTHSLAANGSNRPEDCQGWHPCLRV
jgi:hypothetical protein